MTNRLALLIGFSASIFLTLTGCATQPPAARQQDLSADQALSMLVDGNHRYVAAGLEHPRQTPDDRTAVAKKQYPYAVILGCSDSRVPPEIIFDAGLGDLFVVRVAGNIADDAALGSMEYAVEHLHAPLIVVLGHSNCGAVAATVDAVKTGGEAPGHIAALVSAIKPAVEKVKDEPGDTLDNAVRENVREVVAAIKESQPILAHEVEAGKVKVVGARYDLDTGTVEWLDSPK
jgi:carbonic anhydrase